MLSELRASAVFSSAGRGVARPAPWPNMVLHTALHHGGHFCIPPCRGAGNVRAGTGPGPRFGHRVPKSGPTGWAIPPDPQQPRGGQIPVQGGPWCSTLLPASLPKKRPSCLRKEVQRPSERGVGGAARAARPRGPEAARPTFLSRPPSRSGWAAQAVRPSCLSAGSGKQQDT